MTTQLYEVSAIRDNWDIVTREIRASTPAVAKAKMRRKFRSRLTSLSVRELPDVDDGEVTAMDAGITFCNFGGF